jgi:dipeptidyl-peptidase-4
VPLNQRLTKQLKGKQNKVIEDNIALATKLKDYNLPAKEFFVLKRKKEMN